MIKFLAAIAAMAGPAPAGPAGAPAPANAVHTRCAFQTAEKLALASDDTPHRIAEEVIDICSETAPNSAPAITTDTRQAMRAAAVAMVLRQRGLDGRPAEAPFRIAITQTMDIPDEIAPAILPYLRCLLASADQVVKDKGRVVPPPAGIAKGSDCTAFRDRATRDAETMLRARGGQNKGEREAFIAKALQDMDRFQQTPLGKPTAAPAADPGKLP